MLAEVAAVGEFVGFEQGGRGGGGEQQRAQLGPGGLVAGVGLVAAGVAGPAGGEARVAPGGGLWALDAGLAAQGAGGLVGQDGVGGVVRLGAPVLLRGREQGRGALVALLLRVDLGCGLPAGHVALLVGSVAAVRSGADRRLLGSGSGGRLAIDPPCSMLHDSSDRFKPGLAAAPRGGGLAWAGMVVWSSALLVLIDRCRCARGAPARGGPAG